MSKPGRKVPKARVAKKRGKRSTARMLTTADRRLLVREAHQRKKPVIRPRQLEFIKLTCGYEEFTYAEVARYMGVGAATVQGYRVSLFRKLGIKSRTGLVLFAVKWGIVKA